MPKFLTVFLSVSMLCGLGAAAQAEDDVVFKLNASVVKVQVSNDQGNRGIGSGVVVSPGRIVTNCHVVANAHGIAVSKNGESYLPTAMQADWHHDLCILRVDDLPNAPVPLGDSSSLRYEQPVFSIGYPNNPMKPLTAFGKVKGMYTLEDSQVIRTSAAFRMGASGGALFDLAGNLVGINTFKSPGRNGNYYSLPVVWVKRLLDAPEVSIATQKELPFWDAPEAQRPYFMQVVNAQITRQWTELADIANSWLKAEPASSEAWYYLGMAEDNLHHDQQANAAYAHAVQINPRHTNALHDWGLLAARKGDQAEVKRIAALLDGIDQEAAEEFRLALSQQTQ